MGSSKRAGPPAASPPQGSPQGTPQGAPQGAGKAAAAAAAAAVAAAAAAGQPAGAPVRGEQRSCLTSQLRKTKICVYHLKGACQYGNTCAFAHSCTELQSIPDLRKTRLCLAFERGSCTDPDCSFAHGEDELRSTNLFYKKTLCIWNQKGKCRNGDQCRFAHGTSELRTSHGVGPGGAAPYGNARGESNAKQTNANGGKGPRRAQEQRMKEPMKVLPGGCLTPQVVVPVTVGLPTEVNELGQGVSPPPGLPYGSDGTESPLPGMLEGAGWWQWPQGYSMEYNMAASKMMPHVSGASVKEMRAEIESLRKNVEKQDIMTDLQRLRKGVEGLTQKFNALQAQAQAQDAAAAAAAVSKRMEVPRDMYFPGTYLKTASCSDPAPTKAGIAMVDLDQGKPAYWA